MKQSVHLFYYYVESFWEDYSTLEFRHYYEVIEAGRPCKLYFDLEFSIPANPPDLSGLDLVDCLLGHVIRHLAVTWPQHVTPTQEDILLLDSTSVKKFSVHVIFPTVVFDNNLAMGCWVKDFYDQLAPADRDFLTISKEVSEDNVIATAATRCSLIDFGVYTRHRNFRLYLSTKFGKAASLALAETDLFSVCLLEKHGTSEEFDLRRRIFLASLITWVGETAPVRDWPPGSKATEVETPTRAAKHAVVSAAAEKSPAVSSTPYTEIDSFVRQLVKPGFIRKCAFLEVRLSTVGHR